MIIYSAHKVIKAKLDS